MCMLCLCVHVFFACRHREARADLLDEFQLHLQVLQWGPGVERGRGGRGDLQHCHHTQQLPQNQTPRIIEDNKMTWNKRRGSGVDQRGQCRKRGLRFHLFSPSVTFLHLSPHSNTWVSFLSSSPPWFCTHISLLLTETRVQGHRVYITITFCITSRWAQLSKQYGPECQRFPCAVAWLWVRATATEIRADRRCAQCAVVHL